MSDIQNKKAVEILKRIIYITLATSDLKGQPWNSPLSCVYDKELIFYTNSDKNTVHAKNIRENSKVFWTIYDSTLPDNQGALGGIYFQGGAYEVNDKKVILAYRAIKLSKRGEKVTDEEYSKFSGNSNRRVYKFVPNKIWVNDVEFDSKGNYVRDIRVEVSIKKLKALI